MTIKSFLAVASIGAYSFMDAQEITYFNSDWEVTTKEEMVFYREATKKGNLTQIKDFYKNGVMQMEGTSSNPVVNEEIWEGQVTWYFPSGKPQTITNFKEGKEVGISKSYDENGKIIEDLVYDKENRFTGTRFYYKQEDGNNYNTINEYKNSELSKEIVYEEDRNKIRYETNYTNGYENYETKFYDERGKSLGTKYYKDYVTTGVDVGYYFAPMQVKSIDKFGKNSIVEDQKIFFRNGKLAQEKKLNSKDGFQKTYDEKGNKIGEVTYVYSKENDALFPENGTEIQFFYDSVDAEKISVYKEGILVLEKSFNGETKKLLSETTYSEGLLGKVVYYDDNGAVKSTLQYREGLPFDGKLFLGNSESIYNDGNFTSFKIFSEDNKVLLERKFNEAKNSYEGKIYNENQKLVASYTMEGESDTFNGTITQYENGKVARKAIIKDDFLVDGKVRTVSYGQTVEKEKTSKWMINRVYDDKNTLVEENKKKVEGVEEANPDLMYFTEANLYENLLTL